MKNTFLLTMLCTTALIILSAHDMFLKLESYYLEPDSEALIYLYNGTFDKSENVITRDRMKDVTLVTPGEGTTHPPAEDWYDQENKTVLKIKTGPEGTYLAGVSTATKMIKLSAREFSDYLKHDGIMDVWEERKASNETGEVKENYSKHVKAIFQVGEKRTDDYNKALGYPVEFIPLVNPYNLKSGQEMQARLLKNGKPLKNHLVYANYAGHHSHGADGDHEEAITGRTDHDGVVSFKITTGGHWYLRTINMVESKETGIDYESNWATLTFEVK